MQWGGQDLCWGPKWGSTGDHKHWKWFIPQRCEVGRGRKLEPMEVGVTETDPAVCHPRLRELYSHPQFWAFLPHFCGHSRCGAPSKWPRPGRAPHQSQANVLAEQALIPCSWTQRARPRPQRPWRDRTQAKLLWGDRNTCPLANDDL